MLWGHPNSHQSPESPESKFTTQGGNRNQHELRKPKWLQLTGKTKPQWTPASPAKVPAQPPHHSTTDHPIPEGWVQGPGTGPAERTPSLHHAAQLSTGSRPRERERKEKVGRRGPRISVLKEATQGREGETLCPDKGPERNTFPIAVHATQHKTPQRQASRNHYPPSPTSSTTPTKRRRHSRRKYAAPT